MKRVVNNIPKTEVVELSKIKDNSYIGIQWSSGDKSWVTRSGDNEFKSICIGDQNLAGCWTRPTKREYVENAFSQRGTEAYVFESKEELVKFLLNE